jgi:hypothetical protein
MSSHPAAARPPTGDRMVSSDVVGNPVRAQTLGNRPHTASSTNTVADATHESVHGQGNQSSVIPGHWTFCRSATVDNMLGRCPGPAGDRTRRSQLRRIPRGRRR